MAASPSQQTHWLNLRVDLGLQRNSDMDPSVGSGLGRVFFFLFFFFSVFSAPLCNAVVRACMHTAVRRGGEGLCVFSSVG